MEEIYERILRCLSESGEIDGPVLEVGSGSGGLSVFLAEHGFEVIAVDPLNAERIEETSDAAVRYIKSRAESMPLKDEEAGAVVTLRSLHHMDAEKALEEFYRVLKSGGRLCIADWILGADTGIPEKYFAADELEGMLESSGFASVGRLDSLDPDIMLWTALKEK